MSDNWHIPIPEKKEKIFMSNIYCGDRYDDAIHEAMLRLNKAQNAYYAYDNANESYLRLRSRAESGRISKYNTKLGVRVDVSLDGCGDDILADVVDRGNEALALKTVWQSAVMDVRDLIVKSVDVDLEKEETYELAFKYFEENLKELKKLI